MQEVAVLTHLLQGFGSGASAVVEELRILIPVLFWRRGLLNENSVNPHLEETGSGKSKMAAHTTVMHISQPSD